MTVSADLKVHNLGNSDLKVPIVCLGTMTFGEQNSEEEAFAIMDYALSKGVNFFDTAELYPIPPSKENNARTERIIGNWLKARNNRNQVIIATKVAGTMPGLDRSFIVANRHDPPLAEAASEQPDLTQEQILQACHASLRRLQTDYIDLYQIHWPARYAPLFGARQYRPDKERQGVPRIEEQVGLW
eukprot:GHUV01017139.1.p1 GENE.GHUV01017139.1~~GHUV01017139.1.p1  ORF type:complete len:186 (+),score=45.32 GHUV01017139.1:204-761(+)